MKLKYSISRQDYIDFNRYNYFKNNLKRIVILGIFNIVLLEYIVNIDGYNLYSSILVILIFIPLYFFLIYRQFNRTGKLLDPNGSVLAENEIIFGEDKIHCSSKNSEGSINWNLILKVAETSKAFYLYTDKNMAIIIPKRVFTNEKEVLEFQDLIKRKVPSN